MSEKRYLTEGEIELLTRLYGERDYFSRTTIERGNWYMNSDYGLVSNNNIKVGRNVYSDDFSQSNPAWFVHEGAHLVQEQTQGKHLLLTKGWDKAKSLFSNNYQYSDDVRRGVPFEKMAIEAQASLIADYYRTLEGLRPRYARLPAEAYREIIPESVVPTFGRSTMAPSQSNDVSGVPEIRTIRTPRPNPRGGRQSSISRSASPAATRYEGLSPEGITTELKVPSRTGEKGSVPIPRPRPNGKRAALDLDAVGSVNPFKVDTADLQQQAALLERNPVVAEKMILAAGRDPELFGFSRNARFA